MFRLDRAALSTLLNFFGGSSLEVLAGCMFFVDFDVPLVYICSNSQW